MSVVTKKIQVNPELFKVSSSSFNRTRRATHDKPPAQTRKLRPKPLLSADKLKTKLLKRVKEHKQQELAALAKGYQERQQEEQQEEQLERQQEHKDEFDDALNYLSGLKKKQQLHSKTLKAGMRPRTITPAPLVLPLPSEQVDVSLELPPDFDIPATDEEVFQVNYHVDNQVPYGCLKGGKKKTYREWKQINSPDSGSLGSSGPSVPFGTVSTTPMRTTTPRSLRRLRTADANHVQDKLNAFSKLEKTATGEPEMAHLTQTPAPTFEEILAKERQALSQTPPTTLIKKTTKRKYTLGKSPTFNKVGVLLNNNQTRKRVLMVQKDLKKTNIADVRQYLTQHGIIKVGSTCPANILRKTFESAMLAGEVVNTNKDTLLHNFTHDVQS